MLVAIGLVLLMMTLFAQIFGLATEVMGRQKGLSENDQRARMLTTLLRNDLDKRTYRKSGTRGIVPIQPGSTGDPGFKGYFYLGENNISNDTDDVLQLTIETNIVGTTKLSKPSPLYGRAQFLKESTFNLTSPAPPANDPDGTLTYLDSNSNQPEADDGDKLNTSDTTAQRTNSSGSSEYAEVCYFLRGKNLYRRVLLIRRPVNDGSSDQPTYGGSTPLITDNYSPALVPNTVPNGSGYFWRDFDYSAYNDFSGVGHLKFLGISALNNDPINTVSLGIPKFRFGFNPVTGKPVEFVNSGNSFIGRFTHEETSYGGFEYPGVPGYGVNLMIGDGDDTNPLTRTDLTLDSNYVVQGPGNVAFKGNRVQEDLLLTNVHAFDIKVWDPGFILGVDNVPGSTGDDDGVNGSDTNDIGELGFPGSDDLTGANLNDFLDLGHGQSSPKLFGGPGTKSNSNNMDFGNAFDTWHATFSINGNNTLPYGPTLTDGTTTYRVPLQAIQIKIRYVDVASDQMREITLIQSLVD